MPLVAFDTMIMDRLADSVDVDDDWANAMEAMEPPLQELPPQQYAMYWLVTLAPAWRSCVYTFSDQLYKELRAMPPHKAWWASKLLGLALEVREPDREEVRTVDPARRPGEEELQALGIKPADSIHVTDAIGLGATHFLTLDKGILRRATPIGSRWGLRVCTPAEFLLESVRSGAPWPTTVPWPWESGPLSAPST